MSKILYIECASCGAKLKMPYTEGLENKLMRCPQCKEKHPISGCKTKIEEKQEDTATQLSDSWNPTKTIGRLTYSHRDGVALLPLHEGSNTVGRTSQGSNADLQVDDEEKLISRKHFLIDVIRRDGYYEHRLSILAPKGNPLQLNGERLNPIDVIVLNNNDVLTIKGRTFVFTESL